MNFDFWLISVSLSLVYGAWAAPARAVLLRARECMRLLRWETSLCAANESGWPSPTSSAHLDFPAAGRWGPARLAAWLVLLHCFQKLLGVASCCWSAVGGVAAGGLVAVVVPVCGVGGCAVPRAMLPSANSQPREKLRARTFLDEVFHASGPSIATRPRGNGCAGRQRSLAAPNLHPPSLPPEEAGKVISC